MKFQAFLSLQGRNITYFRHNFYRYLSEEVI